MRQLSKIDKYQRKKKKIQIVKTKTTYINNIYQNTGDKLKKEVEKSKAKAIPSKKTRCILERGI